MHTTTTTTTTVNAARNPVVAYLLWFFLGTWGAHRYYVGKIGSGIVLALLNVLTLLLAATGIGIFLAIIPGAIVLFWLICDAFRIPRWTGPAVLEVTRDVDHRINPVFMAPALGPSWGGQLAPTGPSRAPTLNRHSPPQPGPAQQPYIGAAQHVPYAGALPAPAGYQSSTHAAPPAHVALSGVPRGPASQAYQAAKMRYPAGVVDSQYLPLTLNGMALELRLFTDRGSGRDVEFAVVAPGGYLPLRSYIVYDSGVVTVPSGSQSPGWNNSELESWLPDDGTILRAIFDVVR